MLRRHFRNKALTSDRACQISVTSRHSHTAVLFDVSLIFAEADDSIGKLTWLRNISLHLHPLVGGDRLLGFGGVVAVVEVVGASQLGEVVRVKAVLAGVGHALEVRVERAGVCFAGVVASHLACNTITLLEYFLYLIIINFPIHYAGRKTKKYSKNGKILRRCDRPFPIFPFFAVGLFLC